MNSTTFLHQSQQLPYSFLTILGFNPVFDWNPAFVLIVSSTIDWLKLTIDSFNIYFISSKTFSSPTLLVILSILKEDLIYDNLIKYIIDTNLFASKNLEDVIIHEVGHKIYWDKAKELYLNSKNRYNNINRASKECEKLLRKYIKLQEAINPKYIKDVISQYAEESFLRNNFRMVFFEILAKIKQNNLND